MTAEREFAEPRHQQRRFLGFWLKRFVFIRTIRGRFVAEYR